MITQLISNFTQDNTFVYVRPSSEIGYIDADSVRIGPSGTSDYLSHTGGTYVQLG